MPRRQQRVSTVNSERVETQANSRNNNDISNSAPRRSARLVDKRINYSTSRPRRESIPASVSETDIIPIQEPVIQPIRTRQPIRSRIRGERPRARQPYIRPRPQQTARMNANPFPRSHRNQFSNMTTNRRSVPLIRLSRLQLRAISSDSSSSDSSTDSSDSDSSDSSTTGATAGTAQPLNNELQDPIAYIELSSDSDDEVRARPTGGNDSQFSRIFNRFIRDHPGPVFFSLDTNNSGSLPLRRRRLNEEVPVFEPVESAENVGLNSEEFEEALRAEREFLTRAEQIKRDGRLARNQQFEVGTVEDLEYDGDSPCTICLADKPKLPFGCIYCVKCIGCQKCVKSWYKNAVRNNQSRSCPLCRHAWNSITSIKKMIVPRKSCANSVGTSSRF